MEDITIDFNDDFFKFIFFDQYLSDIGSDPYKVLKTFTQFLRKNSINNFITEYYLQDLEIIKSRDVNPDTIELITTETPYLLLGGWYYSTTGHAINLFIEKINDYDYDYNVYVINSGNGVENHGNISNNKVNIIIKFVKIKKIQIVNIFLLNKFFHNLNRNKIYDNFILKKETNKGLVWNIEEYGFCQLELYETFKNLDSENYYKHIFFILGEQFEVYKEDKPQISGTCSFFSNYYFIKYFIFRDKLDKFNTFINDIRYDLLIKFNNQLDLFYRFEIKDRYNILNVATILIKDYSDINVELSNTINNKIVDIYSNFKSNFLGKYIPKTKIEFVESTKIDIDNFLIDYNNVTKCLESNDITLKELNIFFNEKYNNIPICNVLLHKLIYKIYKQKYKLKKIPFEVIPKSNLFKLKTILLHILLIIMEIPEEYKIYRNVQITDNDFNKYLKLELSNAHDSDIILELNNLSDKIIEYRGIFIYVSFIKLLPFSNDLYFGYDEVVTKTEVMGSNYNILSSGIPAEKEKLFENLGNYNFLNYEFTIDKYGNNLLPHYKSTSRNLYFQIIGLNNFDYIINAINSNNFSEINKKYNEINSKVIEEIGGDPNIENEYGEIFTKRIITNGINPEYDQFYYQKCNNLEELISFYKKVEYDTYEYSLLNIIKYMFYRRYFYKTDYTKLNNEYSYYKYIYNNLYDSFYKISIDKIDIKKLLNSYKNLNEELYEDLLILFYVKRHDEMTEQIKKDMLDTLNENSIFKSYLTKNYTKIFEITRVSSGSFYVLYKKIEFIIINIEEEDFSLKELIDLYLIANYNLDLSININNNQKIIEGYTNINIKDNKLLVAEMYPLPIYKKNSNSCYYYEYNNKLIEISIDEDNITNSLDGKRLLNIENENTLISTLKEEHQIIIKKINNVVKKYHIWLDGSDMLIEFDLLNIQIRLSLSKNTIVINNEVYNIITNYEYLNGLYMLNMNNGFLIENNNKKFIFLLMPLEYIVQNLSKLIDNENLYFIHHTPEKLKKLNNNMRSIKKLPNEYHLIELNYNNLLINDNLDTNIFGLFISLIISKNNFGINLIHSLFNNIKNSSNSEIKNCYDSIKELYKDYPYRFLYNKSKSNPERNIYLNHQYFNYDLKYTTFNYNYEYDISNLLNLDEYKRIKELSDYIISLRDDKLDKYAHTKYLSDFLRTFRNNCKGLVSRSDLKIVSIPFTDFERYLLDTSKNILSDLIKMNLLIIPSIKDIYAKYFLLFYTLLIKLKFRKIFEDLNELEDAELNCTNILEIIEPLDPFIIYKPNIRKFEEVCFELTTGYFLRQEQIDKFYEIKDDLISNQNNKTYEILMGKGKTTTITPLIIFYNYFHNKELLNFNIILPSHLVDQSYKIMLKYSQIIDNYSINNKCNYGSLTKEYQINILSESSIKNILLENINKINILDDISKNKIFIFDEIDSLIDPLKSDLNIPENNYDHPLKQKLNELGIEIIKILLNVKEPKVNLSDKIIICSRDIEIYSFTLPFNNNNLSEKIEKKLNETIKIINTFIFNKDYGFGNFNYNNDDKKNFFTAIPYSAINSPLDESEFTDYELCLFLTIKSYFESGLRIEDLEDFFIYASIDYINIEIFRFKYESLFIIIEESEFKEVIELFGKNTFKRKCEEINKKIEASPYKYLVLEFYLNNIIFPKYFKIYKYQSNISTIDLFNNLLAIKKISFSGTVNFEKPCDAIESILENSDSILDSIKKDTISDIIEDYSSKGSIMSSILGITKQKPINYYYDETLDNSIIEINLLSFFKEKINTKDSKYRCLIDAGGLFIKTSINEMVIQINECMPFLDYILYVTKDDTRMYYDLKQKIHKIYNDNILGNNIFIYYDHKHCVGIDFKQPKSMHGLVTIGVTDTLTRISQGIFRLRKINKGHTIDFYLPNKLKTKESEENFIYNYLNKIEENYKNSTLKYMQLQCIKFILRNIINSDRSYKDKLYYDLVKYNEEYVTNNEFITDIIEKYNNTLIDKGINIKFKKINFDIELIKISYQQALNINVSKEIEQNIELKQNINRRLSKVTMPYIEPYNNVEPYEIFNGYKFTYDDYDNNELLRIGDININLSTTYVNIFFNNSFDESRFIQEKTPRAFNYRNDYAFKNKIYYMYDKINNHLFVIFEADYFYIIDEIKQKNKEYYKTCDIIIYDIYGSSIYDTNEANRIPKKLEKILNNLFFKKQISIIDLYHTLNELKDDKLLRKKLELYSKMFNIDLKYNLNAVEIINFQSYYNILDWCFLFNIKPIKEIYNILSKIINLYINKYEKQLLLLDNNNIIYTFIFTEDEYNYLYNIINDKVTNIISIENKKELLNKLCNMNDNYINIIDKIKKDISLEIFECTPISDLNIIKTTLKTMIDSIISIKDNYKFYFNDIVGSISEIDILNIDINILKEENEYFRIGDIIKAKKNEKKIVEYEKQVELLREKSMLKFNKEIIYSNLKNILIRLPIIGQKVKIFKLLNFHKYFCNEIKFLLQMMDFFRFLE